MDSKPRIIIEMARVDRRLTRGNRADARRKTKRAVINTKSTGDPLASCFAVGFVVRLAYMSLVCGLAVALMYQAPLGTFKRFLFAVIGLTPLLLVQAIGLKLQAEIMARWFAKNHYLVPTSKFGDPLLLADFILVTGCLVIWIGRGVMGYGWLE